MEHKNPNDLTDEECKWLIALFGTLNISGNKTEVKKALEMLDSIESKLSVNEPKS